MVRSIRTLAQTALVVSAFFGLTADFASAQAPASWTQIGMLSCRLNPSIGFIIFDHQSMECQFTQNGRFPPQAYESALNTVGIDIGVSAGGVLGWAVLAPTAGPPPGALAANMSEPPAKSALASAPASTSWLAVLDVPSPYSRSRLRARLPST
jgi:hypothetical protein